MININLRNISFKKEIKEVTKQPKYSYILTDTELQYKNSQGCISDNEAIKIVLLVTDIKVINTLTIGIRTFLVCNDTKIGYLDFNKLNIFGYFVNFNKLKQINNIESLLLKM